MTHYDGYFGAVVFFLVLQWVAALGRVAIRIFIVRKFGIDDVAMLMTLIVSTAYDACFLAVTVLTGGGQPNWAVEFNNLFPAVNTTLAILVLYILGTMLLKVALGLLLLRVLVKRWQVWTISGLMALSVAYGTFYLFFTLFECGNPKYFALRIIVGQCLSKTAINGPAYTHGTIVALTDCAFAALPVALIRKTDMSKRSKISVAAILGLGSVGCVCTFVRLAYIHDLTNATISFFATTKPIALLSAAELAIGITCISLSCYKPFFHKFIWTRRSYYYEDESYDPRVGHDQQDRHSAQMRGNQKNRAYFSPTSPTSNVASNNASLKYHTPASESSWPFRSPTMSMEYENTSFSPNPISPVR